MNLNLNRNNKDIDYQRFKICLENGTSFYRFVEECEGCSQDNLSIYCTDVLGGKIECPTCSFETNILAFRNDLNAINVGNVFEENYKVGDTLSFLDGDTLLGTNVITQVDKTSVGIFVYLQDPFNPLWLSSTVKSEGEDCTECKESDKEKLCLQLYDVNYNNDPRGCGNSTHLWMVAGGGNSAVYTDWTWEIDDQNVISNADSTFTVTSGGGAGWNQNFTLTIPVMNSSNPFGHTWEWFNAGAPCYRIWSILGCDPNLLKYSTMTVTITRGSVVRNVTMEPEFSKYNKVNLWRCADCSGNENVYLDGANNVISDLYQYVSDEAGVDLGKLQQYFPTQADLEKCFSSCNPYGEEPEIPESKIDCTTYITELCDDFDNSSFFRTSVICTLEDETISTFIEDTIEDPRITLPEDLTIYEVQGTELAAGCVDCEQESKVTLCDENCNKVDFVTYTNCAPEYFVSGTDIPYTVKGELKECEPINIISEKCYEAESFAYSWDNGYAKYRPNIDVFPGAYNTPHGSVININSVPATTYQGFIDKILTCGTATIDDIVIDGTSILPNPVVETTTSGTWGGLNTLLWNTITANTSFNLPTGIGCDRPPITPSTNCYGQSISCDDIPAIADGDGNLDIGYFDVTDCKGVQWRFSIRKKSLGITNYSTLEYLDCNGERACIWYDTDKNEIEEPDTTCLKEINCIAQEECTQWVTREGETCNDPLYPDGTKVQWVEGLDCEGNTVYPTGSIEYTVWGNVGITGTTQSSVDSLNGIGIVEGLATATSNSICTLNDSMVTGLPNAQTWVNFDIGDTIEGTFANTWSAGTGGELLFETQWSVNQFWQVELLLSDNTYSTPFTINGTDWMILPNQTNAYQFDDSCSTGAGSGRHFVSQVSFSDFGITTEGVIGIRITFLTGGSADPDFSGAYITDTAILGEVTELSEQPTSVVPIGCCEECKTTDRETLGCSTEDTAEVSIGDTILTIYKEDCNGTPIEPLLQYNIDNNNTVLTIPVFTESCDPQPELERTEDCIKDTKGVEWVELTITYTNDPSNPTILYYNKETNVLGTPEGDSSQWTSCDADCTTLCDSYLEPCGSCCTVLVGTGRGGITTGINFIYGGIVGADWLDFTSNLESAGFTWTFKTVYTTQGLELADGNLLEICGPVAIQAPLTFTSTLGAQVLDLSCVDKEAILTASCKEDLTSNTCSFDCCDYEITVANNVPYVEGGYTTFTWRDSNNQLIGVYTEIEDTQNYVPTDWIVNSLKAIGCYFNNVTFLGQTRTEYILGIDCSECDLGSFTIQTYNSLGEPITTINTSIVNSNCRTVTENSNRVSLDKCTLDSLKEISESDCLKVDRHCFCVRSNGKVKSEVKGRTKAQASTVGKTLPICRLKFYNCDGVLTKTEYEYKGRTLTEAQFLKANFIEVDCDSPDVDYISGPITCAMVIDLVTTLNLVLNCQILTNPNDPTDVITNYFLADTYVGVGDLNDPYVPSSTLTPTPCPCAPNCITEVEECYTALTDIKGVASSGDTITVNSVNNTITGTTIFTITHSASGSLIYTGTDPLTAGIDLSDSLTWNGPVDCDLEIPEVDCGCTKAREACGCINGSKVDISYLENINTMQLSGFRRLDTMELLNSSEFTWVDCCESCPTLPTATDRCLTEICSTSNLPIVALSRTTCNTALGANFSWNNSGDYAVNDWLAINVTGRGFGETYTVDWGDGTIDTGLSGSITHQYSTPGSYTVTVTINSTNVACDGNIIGTQIITIV